MEHRENYFQSTPGIRHFFQPHAVDLPGLSIRGIGVRERMPACRIERPHGTPDYLFMLFHDAAETDTREKPLEPLRPDMMMIWPPCTAQYYGNEAGPFSHSWIHCEGERVRTMLHESRIPVARAFHLADTSRFQQCLLEMHGELVSYTQPSAVIVGNLLENCVHEIARAVCRQAAASVRVPENLLAVRKLIGTAPARSLTLQDLAAIAGMSVPHFSARFRKTFGLSPIECLIQHRMHHAMHLLTDRNLSVAQVATQVGYDDVFHFSKMFKKHFGASPRDMRNRIETRHLRQ
ncbi:MAG: helix-turn-helix transcriptional regulator [Candidatus Methylacidiphilales bacterium]|nr:AraC family transcriptional regulator [Candidatus Methylacidiphilales bacterium]